MKLYRRDLISRDLSHTNLRSKLIMVLGTSCVNGQLRGCDRRNQRIEQFTEGDTKPQAIPRLGCLGFPQTCDHRGLGLSQET